MVVVGRGVHERADGDGSQHERQARRQVEREHERREPGRGSEAGDDEDAEQPAGALHAMTSSSPSVKWVDWSRNIDA